MVHSSNIQRVPWSAGNVGPLGDFRHDGRLHSPGMAEPLGKLRLCVGWNFLAEGWIRIPDGLNSKAHCTY